MEISNKGLAVLLVAAIVISIGGAMINVARLSELAAVMPLSKLTGYGVTGIVNVTLQETASLNVTQTFVDFGSGRVNANTIGAQLITDGTNINWTNYGGFAPQPLRVMNIGNVNLSISVVANKNAATYLGGGTNPSLKFNSSNNGTNPCSGTLAAGTFTELSADGGLYNNTKNVCSQLQFLANNNEIYVGISLYIPYDTPTGNKTMTLTFNGSTA